MLLGYLAALVAHAVLDRDDDKPRQLDLGSPGAENFKTQAVATNRELLQLLDESVVKAREALSSTTDNI